MSSAVSYCCRLLHDDDGSSGGSGSSSTAASSAVVVVVAVVVVATSSCEYVDDAEGGDGQGGVHGRLTTTCVEGWWVVPSRSSKDVATIVSEDIKADEDRESNAIAAPWRIWTNMGCGVWSVM